MYNNDQYLWANIIKKQSWNDFLFILKIYYGISIKKAWLNVYNDNIATSCLVFFKHGKENLWRKEKAREEILNNCTLSLIIIMMNYVFLFPCSLMVCIFTPTRLSIITYIIHNTNIFSCNFSFFSAFIMAMHYAICFNHRASSKLFFFSFFLYINYTYIYVWNINKHNIYIHVGWQYNYVAVVPSSFLRLVLVAKSFYVFFIYRRKHYIIPLYSWRRW